MNDQPPPAGEPNPYEAPQSDERLVRHLARKLGPLKGFLVALAALASGVIACGTSCCAITFSVASLDKGLYVGLAIGFAIGATVGIVLLDVRNQFRAPPASGNFQLRANR